MDHGDIDALGRSIATIGLLHPIVVTLELELIAGERRLMACVRLQWERVPARLVDLQSIVLGEYAENELRKDFTVSERPFTYADLEGLAQAIARRSSPTYETLFVKICEVVSATSVVEVQAIVW